MTATAAQAAKLDAGHHAFELLLALVNAGETLQEVGARTWALAEGFVETRGPSYQRDWARIEAVAR